MIRAFVDGGPVMWPLAGLAVGVVGVTVRAWWSAARGVARGTGRGAGRGAARGANRPETTPILFWGAVAFLVGGVGTVVGLGMVASAVAAAGEAPAALLWGGVSVALSPLIFGNLIFLLAGALWLGVEGWGRRRAGRGEAGVEPGKTKTGKTGKAGA